MSDPNPYRLVIFDWEGTLGDALGPVLHSILTEAANLGLEEIDLTLARQCAELGLSKVLKKMFPGLDAQKQSQLQEAVHHSLISRSLQVFLMPGAEAFVKKLHEQDVALAIASNKGAASLRRDLQASHLDAYFSVFRTADQVPPKPCPQMLEEILDVFDCCPEDALMIGDAAVDMQMATSLKVDAIGIDFSGQHSNSLYGAGALKVFNSYENLAHYLELGE